MSIPFPPSRVLNIPGLWNSGPEHWQSQWERAFPNVGRVEQHEWAAPVRDEWVATLERVLVAEPGPVLLTAHSTGCATLVFWSQIASAVSLRRVIGALLVGPSDTDAPSYPSGPVGFAPMPLTTLPFPAVVAASTDDFYCSVPRATQFAKAWGARLELVGALGHINSDSKLGLWPQGQALLASLAS